MPPAASIIVPTRARPGYLEVALASIAPQARRAGADVLVVDEAGPTRNRAPSPSVTARRYTRTTRRAASTPRATPASTPRGAS